MTATSSRPGPWTDPRGSAENHSRRNHGMPKSWTARAVQLFVSPVQAAAEDTRFELVRGCPQHAFQMFVWGYGDARGRPDLRRGAGLDGARTALDGGECKQNRNQRTADSGQGDFRHRARWKRAKGKIG